MNTEDFLAAPQGFEPRYADPESAVLPLNEGAVDLILWALRLAVNPEAANEPVWRFWDRSTPTLPASLRRGPAPATPGGEFASRRSVFRIPH